MTSLLNSPTPSSGEGGTPHPAPVPPELVEVLTAKLLDKIHQLELVSEDRQALLGAFVRTQEEERRRIAIKLHDDAVQVMFAAGFMLEVISRQQSDHELTIATRNIATDLTEAGERLSLLKDDLEPPSMSGQSLREALTRAVRRAATAGGFSGSVEGAIDRDPSPEQFTVVYRIAQEALAHAARHSEVSRVSVVVANRDDGVLVRVEDDGVGCSTNGLRPGGHGIGLIAMRERAELAGGWWGIESEPPQRGSVVEFWVPLEAA